MRTRFISCATLVLAASLFLPVALRAQESTAVADEIIRITKAAWAADMEAKGIPGKAILEDFHALVKEHSK